MGNPLAELGEVLSDDQIMQFTQGARKKFIHEIAKDDFPQDTKTQIVFLKALSDMDKAALGNKKIGAAERQTASDALVAKAIIEISNKFGERHPFEVDDEGKLPVIEHELLPPANPVPGETDIGLSSDNYESLVSRFD